MRLVGIVALAAALGGCASVTRGTTENISITSTPSGVEATVSGLDVPTACITPCAIVAKRSADISISFAKPSLRRPGLSAVRQHVQSRRSLLVDRISAPAPRRIKTSPQQRGDAHACREIHPAIGNPEEPCLPRRRHAGGEHLPARPGQIAGRQQQVSF
jgi:hypothetical protein